MPASDGQKEAAAALGKHGERPTCRGASFTEEKKQAPIFIVASPRPQVGKTFVARLLVDFQRLGHDDPVVFDLNPRGDALKDYFPDLATVTDLNEIKSQMAMFDRLIVDDGLAKISAIEAGSRHDLHIGISPDAPDESEPETKQTATTL